MAGSSSSDVPVDNYFDEDLDELLLNFSPDISELLPKEKERFLCPLCEKICLSKGGLTRHKNSKHSESTSTSSPLTTTKIKKTAFEILHPGMLKKLTVNCIEKLSVDFCYPDSILDQFKKYKITTVEEIMPCYELKKPLIVKFNGDAEKFFPSFYNIFKKTPGPFHNLSYHCTLLLGWNYVITFLFTFLELQQLPLTTLLSIMH